MLKTMLALAAVLICAHAFADEASTVVISLKGAAALELDYSLRATAESKDVQGYAYQKTFPGKMCVDSALSHLVGCEMFMDPSKGSEL